MKVNLKANKDTLLKDLLKENHFSYKLICELERNGLNTLKVLKSNEIISIFLPSEESEIKSEEGNLNILYEDDYIIILNKPKDIASIPSIRHYDHNLSNILMNYFNKNNIKSKIHPITRLDYKTSGLIIFAKHRYIHGLFRDVVINKYYKATLKGHLDIKEGYINLPIKDNDSMKREISNEGKQSLTYFKVLGYDDNFTFVEIKLLTGRTHQIRRHFSYLGYPLVGDNIYDSDNSELMLECYKLEFIHPITQDKIVIKI